MAGLFGTAQGVQGALGSLFNSGGVSLPTGGGKLPPERSGGRGGLFGRRIDPAQIQQMLAMAQAAMAGDYAAMGTMSAQMQRNRLLQQQAQAEAEAEEAAYLSAHQALSARGVDKHAIHAMRNEERSRAIMERINPFTLSPNQERHTPGAPGEASQIYRSAPEPTGRMVEAQAAGINPNSEAWRQLFLQEHNTPRYQPVVPGGRLERQPGFVDVSQFPGTPGSIGATPPASASAPDGAPPPPPPGFEIDQPQGGPGRAAAPATFPGLDPLRYPPGVWW